MPQIVASTSVGSRPSIVLILRASSTVSPMRCARSVFATPTSSSVEKGSVMDVKDAAMRCEYKGLRTKDEEERLAIEEFAIGDFSVLQLKENNRKSPILKSQIPAFGYNGADVRLAHHSHVGHPSPRGVFGARHGI